MLKKFVGTIAVAAVVFSAAATQASAQIEKGYTDIGAVIGLGNVGSASAAIGFRGERIIKELPDLGNGLLGVGVSLDYYSYGQSSFYNFKVIPIGVTGNYHFKLENKKIDAFAGAGLGYQILSCSYTGSGTSIDLCGNSSIYFIGRVGGRYFVKPNIALYADAGAGAATLSIGATIKLK